MVYTSKRVVIELPPGIRLPPGEVESRIRVELAIRLYEKHIVSFGQARRIAGIPKWDFLELLAREGIPIHYDTEDLEEDLKQAEKTLIPRQHHC